MKLIFIFCSRAWNGIDSIALVALIRHPCCILDFCVEMNRSESLLLRGVNISDVPEDSTATNGILSIYDTCLCSSSEVMVGERRIC